MDFILHYKWFFLITAEVIFMRKDKSPAISVEKITGFCYNRLPII